MIVIAIICMIGAIMCIRQGSIEGGLGFVLAPLVDIAPTLNVPGVGRAEDLLRRLPDDGIAEVIAA